MNKVDEHETRPLLSCLISKCNGLKKTKQIDEDCNWINARCEKKDPVGNDDKHNRQYECILPKFEDYVEKANRAFITNPRNEKNGIIRSDFVTLPKIEDRIMQKETKRRATPFANSKRCEIKKWLEGTMHQIEEEQHKLNMEDHQKDHSSRSNTKVLRRRRSMLNLGEMTNQSTDIYAETEKNLTPSRRHSTKARPSLHKIHSDSSIKSMSSLNYNFEEEKDSPYGMLAKRDILFKL